MPPRDHRLQFEPGLAGFIRPSRENLLAALAAVLPPEAISKVRAGLDQIDASQPLPLAGKANEL